MTFRRKCVIASVVAVLCVSLAACGKQAAVQIQNVSVARAALTSMFKGSTTRFVITAENLPGSDSVVDSVYSLVETVSTTGSSDTCGAHGSSVDMALMHKTTNLLDYRSVGRTEYLRLDLKALTSLAGTSSSVAFTTLSNEFQALSAQPGLGYLKTVLQGKWIGMTEQSLVAFASKYAKADSAATKALQEAMNNPCQLKHTQLAASSSTLGTIKTLLSIHRVSSNEYSLTLPVKSFARSLLSKLVTELKGSLAAEHVSAAQLTQRLNTIPSGLSLHANIWVSHRSLQKIQIFIPSSASYFVILVSHPAVFLAPPAQVNMLTTSDLTALTHVAQAPQEL